MLERSQVLYCFNVAIDMGFYDFNRLFIICYVYNNESKMQRNSEILFLIKITDSSRFYRLGTGVKSENRTTTHAVVYQKTKTASES